MKIEYDNEQHRLFNRRILINEIRKLVADYIKQTDHKTMASYELSTKDGSYNLIAFPYRRAR